MARSTTQAIGSIPPQIVWTIVRGDTASFRVFVTDDNKQPLVISEWEVKMDIKRSASTIVSLTPSAGDNDGPGEFTVSLSSSQSELLETDDVFDIQLSTEAYVWTVAQGKMNVIEDVTD
jgi:hypothetical protein